MKLLYSVVRIMCSAALLVAALPAGANATFTWIDGLATGDSGGIYTGAPADVTPGARTYMPGARDSAGNLWVFGGYGKDEASPGKGVLNDLWKYDVATGLWSHVSGSKVIDQSGVYGTKNVAAAGNVPGGREDGAMWVSNDGRVWVFGGWGCDKNGNYGRLNDLFMFDPATGLWTWVSGSDVRDDPGTPGSGATATPGNRYYPAFNKDAQGRLVLYGGVGLYGGLGIALNDMWRFDPVALQWTQITGDTTEVAADYGTKGVAAATNTPGSREGALVWFDYAGNLYLFGGFTAVDKASDVWRYDFVTGLWTWIAGPNVDSLGQYGTQGIPAGTNYPGSRGYPQMWQDATDTIWIFGGWGSDEANTYRELNDLWKFNMATKLFTWVKGSKIGNDSGDYGTLGVPADTNIPMGRDGGVSWTDNAGNFWLFGGYGVGMGNHAMNDLWKLNVTYSTDLAVTLDREPPSTIYEGDITTITIQIANNGPDPVQNAQVILNVPDVTVIPNASTNAGQISITTGTATWTIPVLNTGVTLSAKVVLRATGWQPGQVSATAQISSDAEDTNAANNTDTELFEIAQATANLSVTIVPTSNSIILHNPITYVIEVTNEGPNSARDVVVTQQLPNPSRVESSSANTGTIVVAPGTATWTVPGFFGAGARATATVVVTPMAPGIAISTVQTASQSLGTKGSATAEVNVVQGPGPDLSGIAEAKPSCKTAGAVQQCKAKVKATVANTGDQPSPKSIMRVFLSDNATLDPADAMLKQANVKKLKVQKSTVKKVVVKFPADVLTSGKFLLVVLDPDNTMAEGNEFNNTIVVGPLL